MKLLAIINGLPLYDSERINLDNININDIITYKINGYQNYSVVIGTTPTMIKVLDLICENTNTSINFYINNKINEITKNFISPSRKIYKVINIHII